MIRDKISVTISQALRSIGSPALASRGVGAKPVGSSECPERSDLYMKCPCVI